MMPTNFTVTNGETSEPVGVYSIPEMNKRKMIRKAIEDTTDRQRYDIIHKHIKEVRVFNQPKGVKKIEIYFFDNLLFVDNFQPKTFYYAGMKKDPSKRLYYLLGDVPQYIEYENRF